MAGGTITVYESYDDEGDMLFLVRVETYDHDLIRELKRLAGENTRFVFRPYDFGGPVMLDSEEVDLIEKGPADPPNLTDRLLQLAREMRESGETFDLDEWREMFPVGWSG